MTDRCSALLPNMDTALLRRELHAVDSLSNKNVNMHNMFLTCSLINLVSHAYLQSVSYSIMNQHQHTKSKMFLNNSLVSFMEWANYKKIQSNQMQKLMH